MEEHWRTAGSESERSGEAESLSSTAALTAGSLDAHTLLRVEHECPGAHRFREDRPLRDGRDIMSPEVSRSGLCFSPSISRPK